MEKYELQKLRDLPIEGVAERLGLQVRMHKALCPFHDDHHASLSFKKNKYKCWSCGESGDTISLVEKVLHKDFLDACRWLGAPLSSPLGGKTDSSASEGNQLLPQGGGWEGARYERFFEHPFLSEDARRFLFEERKLDERVVRWCRLTSWRDKQGVPWLQTPYYDREGRLVGVQNRNLGLTPDPSPIERGEKKASPMGEVWRGLPRFRFPAGSQCSIYNLPVLNLLKSGDELYIAEGCSDCWSLLSAGHKAIAIPSATLLSRKDIELLQDLNSTPSGETGRGLSFHMFPDNDLPGERLFLQLKEILPRLVRHQLPPGCKDFSEFFVSSFPS